MTSFIKCSIWSTLSRCRLLYCLGVGHLLDHLRDVHAHDRVVVDQRRELLDDRVERHLAGLVADFRDESLEPVFERVLMGQPAADPMPAVSAGLVVHMEVQVKAR